MQFNKLLTDMGKHFQAEYPNEACGIIDINFNYIPCKNLSNNKKRSFILDPVAILEYEDTMWGIAHSHPGSENPLPSEEDIASTVFNEYKFIVGFADKFYIYWWDDSLKIMRYEPFEESHCTLK